jgi:hypothetical protein
MIPEADEEPYPEDKERTNVPTTSRRGEAYAKRCKESRQQRSTTVKCCLLSRVVQEEREVVIRAIDDLVEYVSKISRAGSLFIGLAIRDAVATDTLPADFASNDTFFDRAFRSCFDASACSAEPVLMRCKDGHPEFLPSIIVRDLDSRGTGQAVAYASQQYKTALKNHFLLNVDVRVRRAVHSLLVCYLGKPGMRRAW